MFGHTTPNGYSQLISSTEYWSRRKQQEQYPEQTQDFSYGVGSGIPYRPDEDIPVSYSEKRPPFVHDVHWSHTNPNSGQNMPVIVPQIPSVNPSPTLAYTRHSFPTVNEQEAREQAKKLSLYSPVKIASRPPPPPPSRIQTPSLPLKSILKKPVATATSYSTTEDGSQTFRRSIDNDSSDDTDEEYLPNSSKAKKVNLKKRPIGSEREDGETLKILEPIPKKKLLFPIEISLTSPLHKYNEAELYDPFAPLNLPVVVMKKEELPTKDQSPSSAGEMNHDNFTPIISTPLSSDSKMLIDDKIQDSNKSFESSILQTIERCRHESQELVKPQDEIVIDESCKMVISECVADQNTAEVQALTISSSTLDKITTFSINHEDEEIADEKKKKEVLMEECLQIILNNEETVADAPPALDSTVVERKEDEDFSEKVEVQFGFGIATEISSSNHDKPKTQELTMPENQDAVMVEEKNFETVSIDSLSKKEDLSEIVTTLSQNDGTISSTLIDESSIVGKAEDILISLHNSVEILTHSLSSSSPSQTAIVPTIPLNPEKIMNSAGINFSEAKLLIQTEAVLPKKYADKTTLVVFLQFQKNPYDHFSVSEQASSSATNSRERRSTRHSSSVRYMTDNQIGEYVKSILKDENQLELCTSVVETTFSSYIESIPHRKKNNRKLSTLPISATEIFESKISIVENLDQQFISRFSTKMGAVMIPFCVKIRKDVMHEHKSFDVVLREYSIPINIPITF